VQKAAELHANDLFPAIALGRQQAEPRLEVPRQGRHDHIGPVAEQVTESLKNYSRRAVCQAYASLSDFGMPVEIVSFFGGRPGYLAAKRELEDALYQKGE
jgi:hypothetical protein